MAQDSAKKKNSFLGSITESDTAPREVRDLWNMMCTVQESNLQPSD
jgi:hypothetical protein